MAFPNEEQSMELLKAQSLFWHHAHNFMHSSCLKCVSELGVPDIIHKHGKPMTLQELVDALGINKAKAHAVQRLMRVLLQQGFFVEEKISDDDDEENLGYWLTPATRLLIKDQPGPSMIPFMYALFHPIVYVNPWHHITEWLKNDDTSAFETTYGTTLWGYTSKHQEMNQIFNQFMASDAELLSIVVARSCKNIFDGIKSMVDVGGGTGTMAKTVANAFPHLQCTVFDLPNVVAGLEGSKNLIFVEGNMFHDSIPQADAIMLKWILHDWSNEGCVKILKKCKDAIPSKENGGKVIIIDMIVGSNKADRQATETQLCNDLLMMVVFNGKERTEKEWETLFFDAGYSGYRIAYHLGMRSLIEVYP